MYGDLPYAREVGRAGDAGEAAGVAMLAGVVDCHTNIPQDVLTGVVHWLQKGGHSLDYLVGFSKMSSEGAMYCRNDGCEVKGLLKEFKVCPQCKTTRYCGVACQKQDWTTGGHRETCGTMNNLNCQQETSGEFAA
jgi:hypothetical protein